MVKEYVARVAFSSLSKDALADLVADLLRRNAGREDLDGEDLASALVEAFRPVAAVRGDRVPNVERIKAQYEQVKQYEETRALQVLASRREGS